MLQNNEDEKESKEISPEQGLAEHSDKSKDTNEVSADDGHSKENSPEIVAASVEKESSPARDPLHDKEESAEDDQKPNETEVESKQISESEASIDVAKNGARSRDQSEEKNVENQQVAENASEAFIQNEQLASTE